MKAIEIDIKAKYYYQKWEDFLRNQNITNFVKYEIKMIDKTFIWLDNDEKIIATGSIAKNILKYIAIDPKYQDGSLFNEVISYLINQAALLNQFHLFVFTKPIYIKSFEYVGFKLLAQVKNGAVLETGIPNINDFITNLPRVDNQENKKIATIVANANPFTLGHRYLVETASKENDFVYVFVVREDASLFSFTQRFDLVKKGTSDLKNVFVVSGDEYMVSYATYPAYFLKDDNHVGTFQAALDATLFKNKIAKPLNITRRYLGTEPYSKTTDVYNEELTRILPPEIEVKIINRAKNENGEIITATKVRKAIKDNDKLRIKYLVPKTTNEYINNHFQELRMKLLRRDSDKNGN